MSAKLVSPKHRRRVVEAAAGVVASTTPAELAAVAGEADRRGSVSLGREAWGRSVMRALRATYDAAQTGRENERHWAAADQLSANAANSPEVRRVLRARARYEVANNSYARGIVNTLADYVVGTGPRLQAGTNTDEDKIVEREFTRWMRAAGLARKLWTMRVSQAESGETFALLATDHRLATRVKLDVRLLEADQIATPWSDYRSLTDPNHVDGIDLDAAGVPTHYRVLRRHPGDTRYATPSPEADRVPAASVLHLFRAERPGQARGIPEITAALPMFAMLRRYTLAVLVAAENAAAVGGMVETQQSPEDIDEVEPLDEFDHERGTWMALPEGWVAKQLKAEQPVTTYGDFKSEVLNEVARCLSMPFNIAAGNSSKYNYASGRLDHQAFYRRVTIDRQDIEIAVLDRVFEAWLDEAAKISGYLPQRWRTIDRPGHQWFWPGLEHVDPSKEANAQETRLRSGTTNLAIESARAGRDWEEDMRQRAREIELARELGVPVAGEQPAQAAGQEDQP